MLLNEIKNIAKKESSFFQVEQKENSYNVFLTEEFHRMFPDDVKITEQFFIDEAKKKFGDNIKIQNKNNIIMLESENKESRYTIYVKDPKTGKVKRVSFGKKKTEEEVYAPEFKKPKKKKEKKKEREPKKLANKDVGELLNEIIDPDIINVDQLKMKNKLCPKIWESDDHMHSDVRKALLKNALEFIKFANLENAKFEDIILTGSLANYNWHEGSDLDVHILMDYDQIADDNEFVGDYFKTKKNLWNERLPIQVKDHDVELYVQDTNEPHTSTGVYSILNDKWLTKPIKSMVALDVPNIRAKSIDFMNMIDELETSQNVGTSIKEIERLMDKLKEYRKAGLEDEGEYSTENLVFKVLRNTGYLEKLADLKTKLLTQNLTLENVSMYDGGTLKANINEANFKDKIRSLVRKGTLGLGVVVGLLAGGISVEDLVNELNIPTELIEKAQNFMGDPYEELGLPNKETKIDFD
jgi:hypothetical protein